MASTSKSGHDTSDRSSPTSSKPVAIVVGSGFAGLAAARELRKSNFQVIVLESRDRIGGRVHTDYSFGFPVDLGASWLHGVCASNPLAEIVSRLQLPLYRTSGDDSVLYDHDLESYALYEVDGKKVPRNVVARVGKAFEETLEETKVVREGIKGDISMRKAMEMVLERKPYLRLQGLELKVWQWYLCRMEGWFAADVDQLSVKHWDQENLLEGGHGLMVKGYWPVLAAMAKGLDVRLNHRVSSIRHSKSSVVLTTDSGQHFRADAAVLTVPLGVLKSGALRFDPPLPMWKQSAVADIGVGHENKVALRFSEPFWPNVEFLGVVADSTFDCSYFLNLHKATGNPVLVFMPAGSLAVELEKAPDKQAVEFTMEQLRKILPNAPEPLQYLVSHWGSDPSSLGCYTYDKVGKPADVYDKLRAPCEPLFFAGEATSRDFPGTVHGAFNTGVRAALECKKYLASKSKHFDSELYATVSSVETSMRPLLFQISRL